MHRDLTDDVFSLLVRERVNYNCECCGKNFRSGGLDCSHNVPRRHVATKWHPLCAVAHCRSCHRVFTDNPLLHTRWLDALFGADLMDEMNRVAHTPVHWSKKVRLEIREFYRAELKIMEAVRDSGITAEIGFRQHDMMHTFSGGRARPSYSTDSR